MSNTVTHLTLHRTASRFLTLPLPPIDRVAALTQIGRSWDDLHQVLTSGPGALDDDAGHECLQWLATGIVHPAAVAGLVFGLPQLIAAVRRHDQVRDGDIDPRTLDCHTISEALEQTSHDIDCELYPLLTGKPIGEVCLQCSRTGGVTTWRPWNLCSAHRSQR